MKIFSLRLKSLAIVAAILLAVVLTIFIFVSTVSDSVDAPVRLIPIYCVDTDNNNVAVSFNCAQGDSDVDRILAILEAYNIKATFFMLGSWADSHTEEVTKIFEAGHELGNHSYTHSDMPSMSYESILLDIQNCNETVRSITGVVPKLFRAPSGSYDNKTINAATELDMTTIQWSVDSLDWKDLSAEEIFDRVTSKTESGSIIQFHTGTAHTADALPGILDFFEEKNFKCVTVGSLIITDNYIVDNNGMQIAESSTL